jgi:hypothetical protein
MQPGKSTSKNSRSKIKETLVSPETVVAVSSAQPAAAPRKRTAKTAAADRTLPASKPRTPRATQHRSAKPASAAIAVVRHARVPAPLSNERIAELAYSYWLARGCQGGDHLEDWFRAEHELRSLPA